MNLPIIDEHILNNICLYRQNGCCRYIIFLNSVQNFVCAKKNQDLKSKIDLHVNEMLARGDNCPGI